MFPSKGDFLRPARSNLVPSRMSDKLLRISDELVLPLDGVTQRFAFLGNIGSGKSYGASKLAEEMLGVGVQVVVLDPVAVYHLRSLGLIEGEKHELKVVEDFFS
jgi:hypothetical protein